MDTPAINWLTNAIVNVHIEAEIYECIIVLSKIQWIWRIEREAMVFNTEQWILAK